MNYGQTMNMQLKRTSKFSKFTDIELRANVCIPVGTCTWMITLSVAPKWKILNALYTYAYLHHTKIVDWFQHIMLMITMIIIKRKVD